MTTPLSPFTSPSRGLVLGVDTGGTTTDAVLITEPTARLARSVEVLASAKAPTTHGNLAVGIDAAVARVLEAAGIEPREIGLVALSTTLATNAIVEGRGRRAALVTMGFEADAMNRAGLAVALGRDIHIRVAGGHRAHGDEIEPIDLVALATAVDAVAGEVEAFAVTSQFSVRNPSHEEAARALIVERTGRPVTCSHELSARLNGPRRAVTALLNARLIAMIDELLSAAADRLRSHGVDAPIMVMRGNGSLVSEAFVRSRPIETILSGPAASVVGAGLLADAVDAVVVDTGGTTTDIAVLTDHLPRIDPDGAVVGGHRCMVEAVATSTHGLGGDSEVRHDEFSEGLDLSIGPRRVVPLVRVARDHPHIVMSMLDRQLADFIPGHLSGRLVWRAPGVRSITPADATERGLLERISEVPVPLDAVIASRRDERALDRLRAEGFVASAGFTPTDACHVLGLDSTFDPAAAIAGAQLLARRPDRFGKAIATDETQLAATVVAGVTRSMAVHVLGAALAYDGRDGSWADAAPAVFAFDDTLGAAAEGDQIPARRVAHFRIELDRPIVGLGGPAPTFHPPVGRLLGTEAIVPAHAEVANAVGAAGGLVQIWREVSVTTPRRGILVAHLPSGAETFYDLEECRSRAEAALTDLVLTEIEQAGGIEPMVTVDWDVTDAVVEDRSLFVGARMRATATALPRHFDHTATPTIRA